MTSFVPGNKWPKTERAKQFLLFASRLRELMHPEAQDIYRVHALSTLGKLAELEDCCAEVLQSRYPKATLKPILGEVNECLESDIIVRKIVRSRRVPITNTKFDFGRSTEAIRSLVRLWRSLLEASYEKVLQEEILDALGRPRLKKKLLIATGLYGSHLMFRGVNRDFILACVNETFFSKDIGQCTDAMILRFFDRFNEDERLFSVVIFGGKELTSFFHEGPQSKHFETKQSLEKHFGQKFDGLAEFGAEKHAIAFMGLRSENHYVAFHRISLLLNLPASFQVVYPSPNPVDFDRNCLSIDEKGKSYLIIDRHSVGAPVHSFTSQISYSAKMFQAYVRYAWSATENQDHETFMRLNRSTDAASASIVNGNPSTQLVSLWSAFEALLPPPAREEKEVRINHFVGLIKPCIVRKFIRGKFRIFIDDADRNLEADFDNIFPQDMPRSNKPRYLAEAILEDSPKCKEVFFAVSGSPLMLQKLFELGKLVRDPAKVKTKIDSHDQRVEWQLHRIYRERNLIVHSGRNSDCLPILVENLFLYYRLVMRALQQMHTQFGVYHTDSALELVSALYHQKRTRLDEVLRDTGNRAFQKSYLDTIFED